MFSSISILLSVILKPTAYLDPGSGSFVIQLLFGAVVGGLVVMKAYWSKIRAFFNKTDQELATNEQMNPETGEEAHESK